MAEQKQKSPSWWRTWSRDSAPVEKRKDFKGYDQKLVSYLGAYKIAVFFVMIFAAASTMLQYLGTKRSCQRRSQKLFTGLIKKYQGTGDISFDKIGGILLFMLRSLCSCFAYLGSSKAGSCRRFRKRLLIGCGKRFLKKSTACQ